MRNARNSTKRSLKDIVNHSFSVHTQRTITIFGIGWIVLGLSNWLIPPASLLYSVMPIINIAIVSYAFLINCKCDGEIVKRKESRRILKELFLLFILPAVILNLIPLIWQTKVSYLSLMILGLWMILISGRFSNWIKESGDYNKLSSGYRIEYADDEELQELYDVSVKENMLEQADCISKELLKRAQSSDFIDTD